MPDTGTGVRSRLTYFTYTGWIVLAMLALTAVVRLRLGERGWMFTWQVVAVGIITATFVIVALLESDPVRARRVLSWRPLAFLRALVPARFSVKMEFPAYGSREDTRVFRSSSKSLGARLGRFAFAASTLAVLAIDHRFYVVIFAIAEAAIVLALRPHLRRSSALLVFLMAVLTWGLSSGITYTHLADWILNAGPASGLAAAAFVVAFGFVLVELNDERRPPSAAWVSWAFFALAAIAFSAYAFRTDHLLSDWVPIHRSYFADIANFVRDGHHLLWDVPSLYGFLSIATLAVVPASGGWQALYEVTGIFLTIQGLIVFAILRWGRGGWMNGIFAIALPLAMLFGDSISRYAWSARLYPQGGMRFFWIVSLLFVFFLRYVWRERPARLVALRGVGYLIWIVSVLWSFEAGLWATTMWLPYIFADALARGHRAGASGFRLVGWALLRCWPLVALPLASWAAIELVYRDLYGITPDWRSYVDFTGLFASGGVREIFHVQVTGAAWSIILVLGAIGALAIAAIRAKRWPLAQLLAGTWLAVWATSSYYAVEPLDLYVTLLDSVMAPAIAIAIFASREIPRGDGTALLARLSFAPLAIIAIALAIGEPGRLAAMQLPGMPGWTPDVVQKFRPISGELGALIRTANVRPDDYVAIPNGKYWTELSQGLILPFAANPDGSTVEYRSWLPTSPVAPEMLLNGLTAARRRVYIERFLDVSRHAGWLITYRQPADCSHVSHRLVTLRSYSSTNFSISLCALNDG